MIIGMSRYGSALCTRALGRAAFDEIGPMLAEGHHVVFDFQGVDTVGNSFADELFGRLASDLGFDRLKSATSFENIGRFPAAVIRTSIDRRIAAGRVCDEGAEDDRPLSLRPDARSGPAIRATLPVPASGTVRVKAR